MHVWTDEVEDGDIIVLLTRGWIWLFWKKKITDTTWFSLNTAYLHYKLWPTGLLARSPVMLLRSASLFRPRYVDHFVLIYKHNENWAILPRQNNVWLTCFSSSELFYYYSLTRLSHSLLPRRSKWTVTMRILCGPTWKVSISSKISMHSCCWDEANMSVQFNNYSTDVGKSDSMVPLAMIKWNFTKFLVNRDGSVIERFEPKTPALTMENRIKEMLAEPAPTGTESSLWIRSPDRRFRFLRRLETRNIKKLKNAPILHNFDISQSSKS